MLFKCRVHFEVSKHDYVSTFTVDAEDEDQAIAKSRKLAEEDPFTRCQVTKKDRLIHLETFVRPLP